MSPPVPLWNELEAVLQRIATHTRCALHLDYDGTLTPIVAHPAEARLSPPMRRVLLDLARHPRFRVAIVSGRALGDLRACVGIEGIWLGGNHGLEIEGPGSMYTHPEARRLTPRVTAFARALAHELVGVPGAWVEDKGLTLTVHVRFVPPSCLPAVERCLARLLRPAIDAGILTLRTGKAALEIRPHVPWDKGDAVGWITERMCSDVPAADRLTVYMGDDETDEDAFRAVQASGIGVRVGKDRPNSAARYYVDSVEQIQCVLSRLCTLV
jgi:trehalose 6-phosphate phosphatase